MPSKYAIMAPTNGGMIRKTLLTVFPVTSYIHKLKTYKQLNEAKLQLYAAVVDKNILLISKKLVIYKSTAIIAQN